MSQSTACPLCSSESSLFFRTDLAAYHECSCCRSVFMDASCYLPLNDERRRYVLHRNDPRDAGYRMFVSPIVDAISKWSPKGSVGIDYGSGLGSAVAVMLEEKGYGIHRYDPFLIDGEAVLPKGNDFVACCEVAEHFKIPLDEFRKMADLLRSGGILAVMTDMSVNKREFSTWHYKNDETHVFFYTQEAMKHIARNLDLKLQYINGRMAVFEK